MSESKATSDARSVREALAAQLLGELDDLVRQVEAATGKVDALDARMAATAQTLTDAADGFKLAATAFADAAKVDLQEYVERRASFVIEQSEKDHRAALQSVARDVFRAHALDEVDRLAGKLRAATAELKAAGGGFSGWHVVAVAATVGVLSAGITAAGLRLLGAA